MEKKTVSPWINQSEKKSKTVSLWINQSERSRTVSLWINQSENGPCQRVRKRDKPAREENRRRTLSAFVENCDKPELEKICYISSGEIFFQQ